MSNDSIQSENQADVQVQAPAEATQAAMPASTVNLSILNDIRLNLALQVGTTTLTLRQVLQLTQGSVVPLDRLVGEPLDVLVNGTLVAKGEVVNHEDRLGVRLTDVISPADRVRSLRPN